MTIPSRRKEQWWVCQTVTGSYIGGHPACINHLVGRVGLGLTGEIVFWLVSLRQYTHPPKQGAV